MKRTFKLEELECANCAAKMEDQIQKLDGVINVSISFMSQKLTLEAVDEKYDQIVLDIAKVIKKIEANCRLVL